MTKENPLFVDSTKFRGDDIGTKIEVSSLLLYDNERAFVVVVNNEGEEQKCPLVLRQDEIYEGTVWLVHQQEVRYYIVIRKDEGILFVSKLSETRASYLIASEWEAHSRQVPVVSSREKVPTTFLNQKERETPLGGILDKWGL